MRTKFSYVLFAFLSLASTIGLAFTEDPPPSQVPVPEVQSLVPRRFPSLFNIVMQGLESRPFLVESIQSYEGSSAQNSTSDSVLHESTEENLLRRLQGILPEHLMESFRSRYVVQLAFFRSLIAFYTHAGGLALAIDRSTGERVYHRMPTSSPDVDTAGPILPMIPLSTILTLAPGETMASFTTGLLPHSALHLPEPRLYVASTSHSRILIAENTGISTSSGRLVSYRVITESIFGGSVESPGLFKEITLPNLNPDDARNFRIAAGLNHIVIADETQFFVVGKNDKGQLGIKDYENRISFTPVDLHLHENERIIAVNAGENHTWVLTTERLFYAGPDRSAWGGIVDEQHTNNFITLDTSFLASGVTIERITSGHRHSLILTSDGSVYGIGQGAYFGAYPRFPLNSPPQEAEHFTLVDFWSPQSDESPSTSPPSDRIGPIVDILSLGNYALALSSTNQLIIFPVAFDRESRAGVRANMEIHQISPPTDQDQTTTRPRIFANGHVAVVLTPDNRALVFTLRGARVKEFDLSFQSEPELFGFTSAEK